MDNQPMTPAAELVCLMRGLDCTFALDMMSFGMPIAALRNMLPGLIPIIEDWDSFVQACAPLAPADVVSCWRDDARDAAQRILTAAREALGDSYDAILQRGIDNAN